jgi:hypothetical protein
MEQIAIGTDCLKEQTVLWRRHEICKLHRRDRDLGDKEVL